MSLYGLIKETILRYSPCLIIISANTSFNLALSLFYHLTPFTTGLSLLTHFPTREVGCNGLLKRPFIPSIKTETETEFRRNLILAVSNICTVKFILLSAHYSENTDFEFAAGFY